MRTGILLAEILPRKVTVTQRLTITTRNARFQQWQALLGNRSKRSRAGEFLVHGVRPITLAVEYDWPIRALLHDHDRALSTWARDLIDRLDTTHVAIAGDLLRELGEKADETPELVAVVGMPDDDLDRVPLGRHALVVAFDRPTSPGNIGTLIRAADAFGATAVLVTGHAADPYDPKSIRASAGSIFAIPVVRVPSHREVLEWLAAHQSEERPLLVATDEHGDVDIAEADLRGPLLLLIGNETAGLSTAWRAECDLAVRIPMTGAASSLNAAGAATVALYEVARQRVRRP